jgi:hypothetical protein
VGTAFSALGPAGRLNPHTVNPSNREEPSVADALPTKVVTGVVRLSYVHVFEPWSNDPEQDKKYSVVILVPKTDKVTIKKIKAAQQAALEAGKSKVFKGAIPKTWKDTFRDGDEEKDTEEQPEFAGCYFMSVNSKNKPGVVDNNLNAILDPTELYSGCYARVDMNGFAFNTSGNKGVSFGLNNIMKVRDGEALGGVRSKAEDVFAEFAGEDDDGDDGLM